MTAEWLACQSLNSSHPVKLHVFFSRLENNVSPVCVVLNDTGRLCACARDCERACACMYAWGGPTVCVFACHASAEAVHKHEHNVLQYVWAEAGTIADCLVCFLFFSPFPPPSPPSLFSCPRFDYNQVFFLILQWAKERRTVQRASRWAASCWTVSSTWGSDQPVSASVPPILFPLLP